jgi:hypothetical protein
LEGLKDLIPQAKARIWPCLPCVCRVRSTAVDGFVQRTQHVSLRTIGHFGGDKVRPMHRNTVESEDFVRSDYERYETKFEPHLAPQLIAGGKLAFAERVVLHRVVRPTTSQVSCLTILELTGCRLQGAEVGFGVWGLGSRVWCLCVRCKSVVNFGKSAVNIKPVDFEPVNFGSNRSPVPRPPPVAVEGPILSRRVWHEI